MTLHIFGSIVTHYGAAANNRGETEGNITTLQKLLWKGSVHTTVSAEAIRWAIRYYWQMQGLEVNRRWNDEKDTHQWQDEKWETWSHSDGKVFIDDDVLGFMKAESAKKEGGEKKGHTDKRRGVLEVARAISMTPFVGDITFNAKSGEKERTSLYGTEVHATRYQYGFAMTPARLREKRHCMEVLKALCHLGEVAGNHSRFLFDFSPESVVLRVSDDPAPRILYCLEEKDGTIHAGPLVALIASGDVKADELFVGGRIASAPELQSIEGLKRFAGVKDTFEAIQITVADRLQTK